MKIKVAVSGGFDPLHVGHLEYLEKAKCLGDKLIVIVNQDSFLKVKKGYIFMPLGDRVKIIKALKVVDEVVIAIDNDQTVAETIRLIRPDIFANGGDQRTGNPKEVEACREVGCKMIFGLGDKIRSSSELVRKAQECQ